MKLPKIFLFVLFPTAVSAQSLPNKPLIENLATLSVAARWCEEYVVDLKSALVLAIEKKANPTKPPYEKLFDETKEKLENIMGETGVRQFCSVTYERYRPGGPVPGFMMKR